MEESMKICPICGESYSEPPALSRIDNQTEICSSCGIRQAVGALIPNTTVEELIAMNKEMYKMNNLCRVNGA